MSVVHQEEKKKRNLWGLHCEIDYGTRDKKQERETGRREGLVLMSWWSGGGRGGKQIEGIGGRAELRARHSVM